ncbi:MAG: cadherin-like beta sandwich domain-containing protein, partial [Clostridia bacterium]|nr:cadherin-like beta sandwich domain-containing protein [Clostridia bacterium]
NTINVMIKSSLNTTAEYKININRLNLDLEAVQAGPYSGGNLSNALWDSTRNAYVVRLDPQTDDLPSAIASVLAKDANNYIRIGHLTRPEKPTQGSMTDEQYAAALAQYEKEVAAYETAAANDYSATDASVVWDGGWRQTSNQSYKIPLIKKDGGFTVVKIQVGVANNYKAQADATIDEKIGTVKTYTFLIGQKYKNTDADIDIYIDGNLLKNPEKVGDEIIYRYGIVKDATVKVGLRIDEHAPTPYDPTVSVNSVSENGIVNRSDYNYPTDGVLTIPVNTARSVSEDTPDTNITIVSIPEAGTGYTHQYKVVIYRLSENTNVLHNSSDNSETVVNETTRYDGETSPNVVDYYKVSESTLTVDENGNKYLRVYIKTEYSKAKITLNGKIYTGITDDDTVISGSNVVNGGDIHGILIPVKDGESVKVIPYVVTSEDGRHTSNNALNVTIQSINTNADYVTVNGVEAYGPFTEDDSDLPYYNSYIPYSVYEKAVNNAEKTSVVVQAAVQSKDTTAELLWEDGDFDYHGNDAKYNIPFRVSHSYLFDDADPDIPHVVKFRIISEAGTMQEYELRVYLADNTNRDVEYDAESDNYSVWVGPAGTINSIPPAKYDKNTGRYTVEIETGITSVDMKVIADYEYAGVDIYDPYTSSYTNNYELHQKQVQLSNLEPNQNYTLYFRIRSQDEMLSGVGDGKEYIVDLIRKSNNRKIDHVYAYPEDKTGKLFQSVVENITVNNPIIIKNITYGTSIVPIEIGADYSTARVGMTIDGVDTVSTNQTLKINIPFDSNDDDVDETTGERSRTFQVTVWSYEGDIAPAYYTLKIIRKMNNLKLKEITLDGRYAEQDRNDPYTFRIDVGADETLVNEIKATALNAGEYVEFENNGFALSSNSYLNYDVSTIPTSSSVTIDIKVGSPDLLSDGTTPDEIAITKLIITKLSPEEMRSDLKLDMFVSDIKLVDSSYVKAAKQSEDKTLVNGKYVYTYNYISYINPTANMAYVKSQTKSASSKIEFFTDFGKPAIASGMLAVDTEASMSGIDDIILKARVTAGDGRTQDYTLMIQKASSELGIDKVYVDATGGLSTETQQTTRVTGKVTGYEAGVEPNTTAISYKVEMPMNTHIAQPFVFAIDPYAVIQFYEYRDGTYVLSNNKQIQGTNVNFAGATTDAATMEDRNLYKFRFKVTSRTNNASQEYVINLINSPEGTQLKNVNIGLRKEGYKDYPIDESEVILKNASITGLTTYLASVPQGRDTAVVKLISENKFAKIYVNGVHQNSAVNTYIDDVKLNGRVTQVPVTVESPSGATQNYTIYIVQYIYNFDLNTVVNDELTERIGDPVTNEDGVIISNYERPTKLPFYLSDADMQINMADPQGHKYYVQIDDGEKILVDDTTNEQTIKSTIKLKEVNSIVQLRVYDEDGFLITINNILIKRDMLDAALGAIRVNDNDAVKTTLDSGKIIYEAYSYSEAENPTAKVDIYAVDKNAAITLTGLTVSQTYTLGAGKGGQLTANVDLKAGDNYFSIELKKSDGSPSIYYTLRIKHIPVDVYLDDLYITKKDNSNKIPFYNSSFIKTVTTYSIKTENDLHEYDVYANAHETHQKLLDYAKTQGWNPNDYETRIKITDAGSEQIDDLSKYIKQYVNSMKTDGTTSEYFRIPIYLRVPHYTKTYYIEIHDPSDENRLADLQVIG